MDTLGRLSLSIPPVDITKNQRRRENHWKGDSNRCPRSRRVTGDKNEIRTEQEIGERRRKKRSNGTESKGEGKSEGQRTGHPPEETGRVGWKSSSEEASHSWRRSSSKSRREVEEQGRSGVAPSGSPLAGGRWKSDMQAGHLLRRGGQDMWRSHLGRDRGKGCEGEDEAGWDQPGPSSHMGDRSIARPGDRPCISVTEGATRKKYRTAFCMQPG